MIGAQASAAKADGGGEGTGRATIATKMAASAFMSKKKMDDNEDDDNNGGILDQRRINEIFVRLKVSEIVTCFFALLGIGCGIIDYEISYGDAPDDHKDDRILLECLCVITSI
jgi:hypothetical protein